MPATDHVKLLVMETDCKLTFSKHAEVLCYRVNKTVSAFSRKNNLTST